MFIGECGQCGFMSSAQYRQGYAEQLAEIEKQEKEERRREKVLERINFQNPPYNREEGVWLDKKIKLLTIHRNKADILGDKEAVKVLTGIIAECTADLEKWNRAKVLFKVIMECDKKCGEGKFAEAEVLLQKFLDGWEEVYPTWSETPCGARDYRRVASGLMVILGNRKKNGN